MKVASCSRLGLESTVAAFHVAKGHRAFFGQRHPEMVLEVGVDLTEGNGFGSAPFAELGVDAALVEILVVIGIKMDLEGIGT